MALFNDKPTQLAMILGKYVMSGGCTDVIGGTMTAGTADANGSALITFAPPFISAPVVIAQLQAGVGGGGAALTASNYSWMVTGVTVSNCYIATLNGSGCTYSFSILGLARL